MDTLFDHPHPPQAAILDYLRSIPGYPFNQNLDKIFVDELLADFDHLDVLEQIKAFRWYHHGEPAENNNNLRLAIRRWLANARY
jgi:hypothetical protein